MEPPLVVAVVAVAVVVLVLTCRAGSQKTARLQLPLSGFRPQLVHAGLPNADGNVSCNDDCCSTPDCTSDRNAGGVTGCVTNGWVMNDTWRQNYAPADKIVLYRPDSVTTPLWTGTLADLVRKSPTVGEVRDLIDPDHKLTLTAPDAAKPTGCVNWMDGIGAASVPAGVQLLFTVQNGPLPCAQQAGPLHGDWIDATNQYVMKGDPSPITNSCLLNGLPRMEVVTGPATRVFGVQYSSVGPLNGFVWQNPSNKDAPSAWVDGAGMHAPNLYDSGGPCCSRTPCASGPCYDMDGQPCCLLDKTECLNACGYCGAERSAAACGLTRDDWALGVDPTNLNFMPYVPLEKGPTSAGSCGRLV